MVDSLREAQSEEEIRYVIRAINSAWRAQRYAEIGTYLADDVVVAPPGTDKRVRGREAYVQSYRDYDRAATTLEFEAGEPQVDVIGTVAVALCPFDVEYELDGKRYHERGTETLVLTDSAGSWRVTWRTMQTAPVAE